MVNFPIALIGVAEKGYASVELSTSKSGGHSSMPEKNSAISTLIRNLHEIHKHKFDSIHTPILTSFLNSIGKNVDGFYGFLFRYNKYFSPFILNFLSKTPQSDSLIRTTIANTIVSAGNQENVIPNTASSMFNFRIIPSESIQSTVQKFKSFYNNKEVEIKLLQGASEPSIISPQDHFAYKALVKTNKEIFPKAITAPSIMIAKTDSFHYRSLSKNIYRFLPIELNKNDTPMIHGINERIHVGALKKMISFYKKLISNI